MSEPDDPLTNREEPADQPPRSMRRPAKTAAEMSADYPAYDAGESEPPRSRFFSEHRFAVVVSAGALAFLLLATGAVFAGFAAASSGAPHSVAKSRVVVPSRATPGSAATATPVRTCSVGPLAVDARLGTLHASVVNVSTGQVLMARNQDDATQVGGALEALTATAAVAVLGTGYQLTTEVVDSNIPGTVVLVGGGDPTLSNTPAGQDSVYTGAPKISDLAAQTLAAYSTAHPGVPITHVVLDSTYWDSADSWNSTWDRSLRTNGEVGEVTALQVDGDRDDPTQEISRRSTDPVARAGKAFVAALGLSGVTTREGAAEDGAPVLATVKSATVATLVQQMLRLGDATLAESLARVVSLKSNLSGSAASLQQAIPLALQKEGMDTQDLTIADGSGLSSDDAVSATFMAALMAKIAQGGALQSISDGLPVAAKTGSLSTRFTGNAAVSGNLDGVTGSIDGSRSLAGSVKAADGTTLAFSFIGVGPAITDDATTALDALAVGIYGCGNNLTNN